MKFKKTAIALAAAAALVAGGVVPAQAATSATGYARCPSGYLCLFDGAGGTGAMVKYKTGDFDMSSGSPLFNNKASSLWNRTNKYFTIWDGTKQRGESNYFWPGQKNTLPAYWNNRIGSLQVQ